MSRKRATLLARAGLPNPAPWAADVRPTGVHRERRAFSRPERQFSVFSELVNGKQ
jgi:hypothetical protein